MDKPQVAPRIKAFDRTHSLSRPANVTISSPICLGFPTGQRMAFFKLDTETAYILSAALQRAAIYYCGRLLLFQLNFFFSQPLTYRYLNLTLAF